MLGMMWMKVNSILNLVTNYLPLLVLKLRSVQENMFMWYLLKVKTLARHVHAGCRDCEIRGYVETIKKTAAPAGQSPRRAAVYLTPDPLHLIPISPPKFPHPKYVLITTMV